MGKLTKTQMKRTCIIGLKLADRRLFWSSAGSELQQGFFPKDFKGSAS